MVARLSIFRWSDGRITEVKQSKTKNNTKMGDKLGSIHCVDFQFGYDWEN